MPLTGLRETCKDARAEPSTAGAVAAAAQLVPRCTEEAPAAPAPWAPPLAVATATRAPAGLSARVWGGATFTIAVVPPPTPHALCTAGYPDPLLPGVLAALALRAPAPPPPYTAGAYGLAPAALELRTCTAVAATLLRPLATGTPGCPTPAPPGVLAALALLGPGTPP